MLKFGISQNKRNHMKKHLPNQNDKLFKEENNQNYGAWLKKPDNKFFLYSEGYRKSGEQLFDFCLENKFYLNTLIYPLVFNYRQFVELRLKELIIMGYKYHGINKDFSDVHSLNKLWNTYRKEIIEPLNKIDKVTLNNVERIISQFNDEDPNSMTFRYPVSRAPKRIESIQRETIDLDNFKRVIDKLIYFFNSQWEMLANYQELQDEMIIDIYSKYFYC